jgi:amino acid adenylation domain-containing protein
VCGAEQLTYRELNERANQLGRYLLRAGVAREARVGVLLERSAAMIWAVLGVLKAGAAYVPLEVTNPQLRMQEVIADAGIGIVLSTEKWRQTLAEAGVKVICLDGPEGTAVAREDVAAVAEKVAPENLAYVIYTSGSTGKPKGVMVQHGSLLNLGDALKRSIYGALGSQLRVTLNAPLTFDASVKQWLQILHGHTLDILPEHVRYDAEALLAYARRNQIDVVDCTPAQLTSLIAAGLLDEGHRPFSAVLVGGDKLDAKTWQLLSRNKTTRFYNVYGPTECTVDTTICLIEESQSANSLGVPIANASIYLLDESLRHVPVGVTGEIHIGGEGVSRGYLGQPALTAERFIPDPFGERPGARLYRSGDLARYSPPTLEFLGRKDQQVKIRGFRIELEEIEAVLRLSELVREAAVMMHEGAPEEKRLVAYAVLHDGRNPAMDNPEGTMRRFLRERLPEFMIPTAFIIMDSFPLNRSGKLDRAALPKAPATPSRAMHYMAPRNANERLIAAIWREVLEVDRVGVDDNFFDLGGHSLLLTRAYGKLQEAIPGNFSVIDLFRYPTVSSLAEFLTAGTEPAGTVTAANVQQRVDKQRAALAKQRHSTAGRRDH